MTIINNKGFRVFLYILGYISCAAVIALAVITALRYTDFRDDLESSQAYAETSSVRYRVSQVLSNLQEEGKTRLEWNHSGLENADLLLFDYTTGEPEALSAAELAKSSGYADVLSGLQTVSRIWENAQSDNWDVRESYYDDNTLNGSSHFLKIRTEDFIRLVKDHAHLYSLDDLNRYFELQNTIAAEPGATISKEAEQEFSLYADLVRYNYTEYLDDGQYFALLDSGLFIYSPEYMNVRRISAQNSYYEFYLNTQESSPLYITLPESLASQTSLPPGNSEAVVNAVFSGVLYQSPLEAFYSSLDDEQRTLVLKSRDLASGMYIYANTAYSFGNDEISGADIYDPRGIMDVGDTNADIYTGSYEKLASQISDNADVYVRYDQKNGVLTQWYRDPSGKIQNYNYVENINALTEPVKESFVFGMNLYESYSDTFVFGSIAYDLCKAVPSPALWLIISAVIFLICVVLLLIGVNAKLFAIDRVPFEIFLIIYLILVFLIGWIAPHELSRSIFRLMQKDLPAAITLVLLIILALYVMTAALFTTIARRIKCRCFIKDLLTVKIVKLCIRGLRFLVQKTARGGERLAQNYEKALSGHKRLIIFGSVLFAVNALLLLIYGMMHDEAVLLSFLIIVAEAFAGYRLLKYSAGVEKVLAISRQIESGDLEAKTEPLELNYNVKELGESLNRLGTGLSKAVESSIRDERTKAELITNVSHDIKTPLTSIISYVDLLKKEPIENERAQEYIRVLDQKSQRLKQLIMDLIEVSKTNTGNIELERTNLNLTELLDQVLGEYEEKMEACSLDVVKNVSAENAVIYADGRRIFRIIDNVLNNVVKYTQPGTRVYIDLSNQTNSPADGTAAPSESLEKGSALSGNEKKTVVLSVKNVSREMLNISAEELTERFVRGDRSRHTEGSGLGLSIARNLTELQGGTFRIEIDGDLFKVEIAFPAVTP